MVFDPGTLDHWQKLRSKRLKNLREYLKSTGKIKREKLLGELGIAGMHRDTAESYLQDLKDAGDIKIENGVVIWIDDNEDLADIPELLGPPTDFVNSHTSES